MKRLTLVLFELLIISIAGFPQEYPLKKVLILMEGKYDLYNESSGTARDLAQILGHFNTKVSFESIDTYKQNEINNFDYLFYVGFSRENHPSAVLSHDILTTSKPIIWLNTGFTDIIKHKETRKKYGFTISKYLEETEFDFVKTASFSFTKGKSEINLIHIENTKAVEVWAMAYSSRTKAQTPYMIRSGNLVYVADIPFLGAKVTDRYLLFADKLHDILKEPHPVSHTAIIRIEDVTPLYDPEKLRQVADLLSERGIPFLVSVVPVYVNPLENEKVYLSDRPELVDALKYMVQNGGAVVMHGTTHQYKGITANDGEFWDAANSAPLTDENPEEFSAKIELGINEFVKNGLYPIAWETPHYMASSMFLNVISRYFSTAVEQRMSINDFDYGQYFPYVINKDIYGQKVFPENLGYVPLKSNTQESMVEVQKLIKNAEGIRQVRDGIAGCFFHPFLDIELLKVLIDGITSKGFTFIDLRAGKNWVKTRDKVILTGSQKYSMNLANSFLNEKYFDQDNKIFQKNYSKKKINGPISKKITLKPGVTYFAEAVDYSVKELTIKEKIINKVSASYQSYFKKNEWQVERVKIIWNPAALGAAYFDQSSFVSVFRNLNIPVDTLFLNQNLNLTECNLLLVPFASANLLSKEHKRLIHKYVEEGGNLVTDCKNDLIKEFGITFSDSKVKLHFVRDKYYPEEAISWDEGPLVNKINYKADDEIFCEDATSGLPIAIGKSIKQGKIIYLNTAFDPLTPKGYSYYPFFMEYVKRYFQMQPIVKRENLEFYYDPGYRQNKNMEELVKNWVKQGIRRIHVAGWHQYPNYTYDYAYLIKLAHANGILVYAWLEPPQVNKKFWDNHPEWREKNYLSQDINKGEDMKASWRYPVAFTDKRCFDAAMIEYLNLLKKYDFDGVNIAEMNFEAGRGLEDPQLFAPMHSSAIAQFQQKYGYDLREIFNVRSPYYWKSNPRVKEQVTNFRVDKVVEFHDTFLAQIRSFAKKRIGFDVIVTFYDTYLSPELMEYYGANSEKMIELQKKYKFRIQPEDPLNKWSTDPDRYVRMGKIYAEKISDLSFLMLDLNILKFREKYDVTPFATLTQTGLESYQLISAASKWAPRFTIYSESSCNPQDIPYFAYASSGMVQYNYFDKGIKVSSPNSFTLQLPPNKKAISIDGMDLVGYRDNQYLIPAGKHTIITDLNGIPGFSTHELQPELLSFTGNLLKVEYMLQKISFSYLSNERTLASINYMPISILVDGKSYTFEVLKGNDCFTVMLPPGNHEIEMITRNNFSYGIHQASFWSTSAISISGILAIILLANLFIALKFIRKRYKV